MRNFREKLVSLRAVISLASIASCSPDRVYGVNAYGGDRESVNGSRGSLHHLFARVK
jgi:hypothetical protein